MGLESYGRWELIYSFANIQLILQSLISPTIILRVAEQTTNNAQQNGITAASSGLGLTLTAVAPFALSAVLCGSFVIKWIVPDAPPELRTVLTMAILSTAIACIIDCYSSTMAGLQKSGITSLIIAASGVASQLIALLFLKQGMGLQSLPTATLITNGISLAAMAFLTRGTLGYLPMPIIPTRATIQPFFNLGVPLSIGTAVRMLRTFGDRWLIARFGNLELVAEYGIAMKLVGLGMEAVNVIYNPLFATISRIKQSGDAAIVRLFKAFSALIILLVGLYYTALGVMVEDIAKMWTGRTLPNIGLLVTTLTLGTGSAILLTATGTALCKGLGRPGTEARYLALSLVIHILLLGPLLLLFGGYGAVLASSLAWMIGSLVFLALLRRDLHELRLNLMPPLAGLAVAIILVLLFRSPIAFQSASGIVRGILACSIYCITVFTLRIVDVNELRRLVRTDHP